MKNSIKRWAEDMSDPDRQVTPYYIQVQFRDITPPSLIPFFNAIPTSFTLSDEQNDKLIKAGPGPVAESSGLPATGPGPGGDGCH